jgi:hypothetical protein
VTLQAGEPVFEEEPQPTMSETELYMALPHETPSRWPSLDEPFAGAAALDAAADERAPASDAATEDEAEHPQEWLDIIEALRRDAEAMPIRRTRIDVEAAPAPPTPSTAEAVVKRKRRRASDTPAQDEWGFFDPDQCGFAALLEKLQEITEQDETHTPRA